MADNTFMLLLSISYFYYICIALVKNLLDYSHFLVNTHYIFFNRKIFLEMKKRGLLIFLMGLVWTYLFSTTPAFLTTPTNQSKVSSSNQTFRWVTNESLNRHELKIHNCTYDAGAYKDSLKLNEYELFRKESIGINLELSGLAGAQGNPAQNISCSKSINKLNGHSAFGSVSYWNILQQFPDPKYPDYGGITQISNETYALVQKNNVYYVDFVFDTGKSTGDPNSPQRINLSSNSNIEGITYDPINKKLYLANEKSPIALYEVNGNSSTANQSFDLAKAATKWGISNVTGLFHLSQDVKLSGTKTSNNMLVLSSESNVIIETDMNGNEISRLSLKKGGANGTIETALSRASGVAYFNGSIYIVTMSDLSRGIDAYIYWFRNQNHKNPKANLGSSVFSKSSISGDSYSGVSGNLFKNDKTYCWQVISTDKERDDVSSSIFAFQVGNPISGCTDSEACNYKPDATEDDNTCEYITCETKITAVTSPSIGNKFYQGGSISIRWADNLSENVRIKIITGNTTSTIINSTPSDGQYTFNIPENFTPSTNYRIIVESTISIEKIKFSNYFTIAQKQYIRVYSPAQQSIIYKESDKISITWEHNVTGTFNISLYRGNSLVRSVTNNRSGINYDYSLPYLEDGTNYRFLVKSNNTNITAYSAYFQIKNIIPPDEPYINLTAPSANAKYKVGDYISVKWNDNLTEPVDIFLFKGATTYVKQIGENVSGNSYTYKLDNLKEAADYNIYIRSSKNISIFDKGANFSLTNKDISVVSPYEGNFYKPWGNVTAIWTDSTSDFVKIELFKGSKLARTLEKKIANTGRYDFSAPSLPYSADYNVVVTSIENPTKKGKSGNFSIEPLSGISNVKMSQSVLGTDLKYKKGENFRLTWNDNLPKKVYINLLKDHKWVKGFGLTISDGIENLAIPNDIPNGDNYQIIVIYAGDQRVYKFSKVFSITSSNGKSAANNEGTDNLNIYPNPTTGMLNVDIPEILRNSQQSLQLVLSDATGRTIITKEYYGLMEKRVPIDLSNYVSGFYFIQLRNSSISYNGKINLK